MRLTRSGYARGSAEKSVQHAHTHSSVPCAIQFVMALPYILKHNQHLLSGRVFFLCMALCHYFDRVRRLDAIINNSRACEEKHSNTLCTLYTYKFIMLSETARNFSGQWSRIARSSFHYLFRSVYHRTARALSVIKCVLRDSLPQTMASNCQQGNHAK